jgi:hypothetical protein
VRAVARRVPLQIVLERGADAGFLGILDRGRAGGDRGKDARQSEYGERTHGCSSGERGFATYPAGDPECLLISGRRTRDLYRVEVATGPVTALTRDLDVRSQASWSSDGCRILILREGYGVDEVLV